MNIRLFTTRNLTLFVILAIAIGALLWLTISFFRSFPPLEGTGIALDWRQIYPVIEQGRLNYSFANYQIGMRNPPWSALLVLPLGFISLRDSWAVITLVTIIILMLSVPRRLGNPRLYLPAVLLLLTSFPSMRHFMDGNYEAQVIAGVLLLLYGYRKQNLWITLLGAICATAKPQETFLLIPVFGLWLLQRWPPRRWISFGVLVAAFVIITMLWKGQDFLNAMSQIPDRGQLMDISLSSTLGRIGVPSVLTILLAAGLAAVSLALTFRARARFSRDRAALLLTASMLAAPYTAGNSYLTIVAVGIIPLFLRMPRLGLLLFVLINLQYIFPFEIAFNYGALYSQALLLLGWGIFAVLVWREDHHMGSVAKPVPNHLPT